MVSLDSDLFDKTFSLDFVRVLRSLQVYHFLVEQLFVMYLLSIQGLTYNEVHDHRELNGVFQ